MECFTILHKFLEKNEEQTSNRFINKIFEHFKHLEDFFEQYFPTAREMLKNHERVLNRFSVYAKPSSLLLADYESLIDLTANPILIYSFNRKSYIEFWLSMKKTIVMQVYAKKRKPFPSSYSLPPLTYASLDFRLTIQLKPNTTTASMQNLTLLNFENLNSLIHFISYNDTLFTFIIIFLLYNIFNNYMLILAYV